MKKLLLVVFLLTFILSGCSEQFSQMKKAVAGINSKANDAATAISEDAHTLRSIQLSLNNNSTVTINELFKSILRDVQWIYNKNTPSKLQIKGTWQDGLFNNYQFTANDKKVLQEKGKVTITLSFNQLEIIPHHTYLEMELNDETVVQESGENALLLLYDAYIEK